MRTLSLLFFLAASLSQVAHAQPAGPSGLDHLCTLLVHDHQNALEDSQFLLELVENEYRARKTLFAMVEKLWAARSIEQEVFLDSKRLRDRTKALMARVAAQISKKQSIADQYALSCADAHGESVDPLQQKMRELQAAYRRADCDVLARELDIARIDYTFHKAMQEATRTLVEDNIKSKYELVLDEYDLSQSKARVDSYKARTAICRKRLEE